MADLILGSSLTYDEIADNFNSMDFFSKLFVRLLISSFHANKICFTVFHQPHLLSDAPILYVSGKASSFQVP